MEGVHSVANTALGLVLGSRIQVFWPLDAAWYTGTVTTLAGLRGMVEYDDGDIEELNLATEKIRLLDTAPAGEADAEDDAAAAHKRHKSGGGGGLGNEAGKEGGAGAAAAAAPGGPSSPTGERLLVRFANPNAAGLAEGPEAGGAHGGKHGGGGGGAHGGAYRSHKAGASGGGGGGHGAAPRSHKAGAGAFAPGDRGVTADGARALVNFSDKGPTFSSAPYGASDAAAVRGWLASRGLVKFAPLFEANEVDMATLPYLTLQDLRDLPIHAVGPRRKLMAALERM